ncbi:MAG: putative GTP cyclohydrolase 1 type 2 [Synergistetes bacterium ADurb.Bin155]|nr:Nif3-like dinuclear metal center hexameric protein [Synergistales bacterium]NMD17556.1 Nif3-like dinuclear metal center hexameric protein [Synergistaceae bacterium]OQB47073.1 MAG: putative GTP cyclohydrolase 1 type 2 [Synergistetes bacterium ADurb.Bin155]MBP8995405.1 Nif3-like dinuclear metal center hexameric protein [Synergistales bacterium]HOC81498.1 Nif3-like dinuclear metal center hexameric protein [Synergistales bacterium]
MLRVRDIIDGIDTFAPFSSCRDWDNSGLQVGSLDWEVSRLAVSLDLTDRAIDESLEKGCSCIVTHHPVIFEPLRNIETGTTLGRKILTCLERHLSVISVHTNWDTCTGGVNCTLAGLIGLEPISSLDGGDGATGWMGVHGAFTIPVKGTALPAVLREKWGLSWSRDYRIPDTVSYLALAGGAGGDLWPEAKSRGSEVFVTADMKYHQVMEAVESSLGVIVVDHGEMERTTLPALGSLLSATLHLEVLQVDAQGFEAGNIATE